MDIEQKIQHVFNEDHAEIDADKFLTNLHNTRETKLRNKQRLTYGVSSFIVILLVGFISITQLNTNSIDVNYDYYYTSGEMTEEMLEEYYDDLMIYLADQSDDIWSTMELYYEVNNESIDIEE